MLARIDRITSMRYRLLCIFVASVFAGCIGSTESDLPRDSDSDTGHQTEDDAASPDPDIEPDASDPKADVEQESDGEDAPDADAPDTSEPVDCEAYRARANLAAPESSASWKWGGGAGYPDALLPAPECSTIVSTAAQMIAALEVAAPGDIVYVEDGARIDLSDQTVCVPEGVWLAGGRGAGERPGATIFSSRMVRNPILKACGDNVRITGLRIVGPDPDECPSQWPDNCEGSGNGVNCAYCTPPSAGIESSGFNGTEIDNNELTGWSYAATKFGAGERMHLHHNHIHHTQRQGLGYGAVLNAPKDAIGEVLIEWNRFNYNRHAVAGSGANGQSYTARDNLVLDKAIGHVFDMHGENERVGDGSSGAGDEILVHNNIVLVPNYYTMVIRGRPERGAWLFDNCLARDSAGSAALQRFYTGNFYVDEAPDGVMPNQYGQSAASCTTQYLCRASAGEAPWTHLKASDHTTGFLRVGDFDGDGISDVFRSQDGRWEWARSGTGAWTQLTTSNIAATSLRLADFDGDGKTDIFYPSGSVWQLSSAATTAWQTIRTSSKRLADLRFGDFNGDGKTDVFQADGSQWTFSNGGSASPQTLRNSTRGVAQVGFGDFDGDGKTDVFESTGSKWQYYSGGVGAPRDLATSGYGLAGMRIVDIDGDQISDILRSDGTRWHVSRGGATSWQLLRVSPLDIKTMHFGDFDGDGVPDVFRGRCL